MKKFNYYTEDGKSHVAEIESTHKVSALKEKISKDVGITLEKLSICSHF